MKFSVACLISAIALVQAATLKHCEKTYEVTADDTCQSIASKSGLTEDNLKNWNKKLEDDFDCDDLVPKKTICVKFSSDFEKRSPSDGSEKANLNEKTSKDASKDDSKDDSKPKTTEKKPLGKPKTTKKPLGKPKTTKKPLGKPKTTKKPLGKPKTTKKPTNEPKTTEKKDTEKKDTEKKDTDKKDTKSDTTEEKTKQN